MRERNAVMCNNALMADVYFNVGADIGEEVRQIPAHKYVLSTSSTVFYAMFYGGLAEPRDVIDVPDVEPEAFLAMLRYMGWDYGRRCKMIKQCSLEKIRHPSLEKIRHPF